MAALRFHAIVTTVVVLCVLHDCPNHAYETINCNDTDEATMAYKRTKLQKHVWELVRR